MSRVRSLKARVRALEVRDLFRRLELADTDAALAEAEGRLRTQKAFAIKIAERVWLCHEIFAHFAERKTVVITETDYCPL